MVLLTSGQVSMVLSSTIVFIFTFLLFLSGYLLQQQTVRGLQAAIKPRLPAPAKIETTYDPHARLARRPGFRDAAYDNLLQETEVRWQKLGFVQLVRSHDEVCTALMLFADLHRDRSPATRVLLFPRSWIDDDEGDDPHLVTSRRLLRTAVRRYKVVLRPIGPLRAAQDSDSAYSLTSIFSLADFDRLIYLAPSGLIIDSLALDSLLAFSPPKQLAALPADPSASKISTSFMVVQPSTTTFKELSAARAAEQQHSFSDDEALFQRFFPARSSLLPPSLELDTTLYYESRELRSLGDPEAFNSTAFFGSTAYVRLTDPELPGPEYDVPYGRMVELRPDKGEARWAWERLYFRFHHRRMEVCGLDLLTPKRSSRQEEHAVVVENGGGSTEL
ncbi:hypothetical protein HDK90DRAFT_233241 [Phyllosticta capitalensis]|uniref:Glycosyltransferase family 8 protein n=1 Tax=Phyllosticta capitalensis TaxID=121624 RepID=A0ABR1YUR7_9PEZI